MKMKQPLNKYDKIWIIMVFVVLPLVLIGLIVYSQDEEDCTAIEPNEPNDNEKSSLRAFYLYDPNAEREGSDSSWTFSVEDIESEFTIEDGNVVCSSTKEEFMKVFPECMYAVLTNCEPNKPVEIQWSEPEDTIYFDATGINGISICPICQPNAEGGKLSFCPGHEPVEYFDYLKEHLASIEQRLEALEKKDLFEFGKNYKVVGWKAIMEEGDPK